MIDKTLSERFETFAKAECSGSSPLYECLSLNIAHDEELLRLSAHAGDGQPAPNLLLGAVHYLLLRGKEHPLKEYYPSLVQHPRAVDASFPVFKSFCKFYKDELTAILESRLVQTNEVRRCAYLYPCFCYMYAKVKQPLSLIEIGTSAGLQLLWDKYCYSYNLSKQGYGNTDSNVRIQSEIINGPLPFLFPKSPPVAARIGLDLHVNDLSNHDDALWLNALIWPEHKGRRQLFEKAARCVIKDPPKLIEGDGIGMLDRVVDQVPEHSAICVFHTHVANQIPDPAKHELLETIKRIGKKRPIFHLYNNMWDRELHLDWIINEVEQSHIAGQTDGHGRWFSWELDKHPASNAPFNTFE